MIKPNTRQPAPPPSMRTKMVRWAFSSTLLAPLQRIETGIYELLVRTQQIMYTGNQITELIGDLNLATNKIAAKVTAQAAAIQALKDQLANAGTISPEEQAQLDAIGAGLTSVVSQLTDLGADPTNPLPVPVDDNPPVPANG